MTKSNLYSLPKEEFAFVARIKEKRELSGISDQFVSGILRDYIKKNRITLPLSNKSANLVIKDIRAILRLKTGRFEGPGKEHLSVKERADAYEILRGIIAKISPKSILDLGCGLNPIKLAEPGVKYYAYDIRKDQIEEIQEFFKKNNIEGKAEVADITRAELPKADLCLILKVLDVLDVKNHKPSESLLKRLECRQVIVSFPTKTISGKQMNHPQRGWIERLCSRLGYSFNLTITENEIFYLIEKH